ncbi:MAG: hypothetical protein ACRDV6_05800 [Acidimicrobiales bacterium]
MARATLAMPPPPAITRPAALETDAVAPSLARRRDLHVARRLRRRDALAGLGVLAATLGATVAVLDVLH